MIFYRRYFFVLFFHPVLSTIASTSLACVTCGKSLLRLRPRTRSLLRLTSTWQRRTGGRRITGGRKIRYRNQSLGLVFQQISSFVATKQTGDRRSRRNQYPNTLLRCLWPCPKKNAQALWKVQSSRAGEVLAGRKSAVGETWLAAPSSVVSGGTPSVARQESLTIERKAGRDVYRTAYRRNSLRRTLEAEARSNHGGRREWRGRGSGASPGGRDVGAGGALRGRDQQGLGCRHPRSSREVSSGQASREQRATKISRPINKQTKFYFFIIFDGWIDHNFELWPTASPSDITLHHYTITQM